MIKGKLVTKISETVERQRFLSASKEKIVVSQSESVQVFDSSFSKSFQLRLQWVDGVVISEDLLVVIAEDIPQRVQFYSLDNFTLLSSFPVKESKCDYVSALKIDDKYVYLGGSEGVEMWTFEGKFYKRLWKYPTYDLVLSPPGRICITTTKGIQILSLEDGIKIKNWKPEKCDFDPYNWENPFFAEKDNFLYVSMPEEDQITVWNMEGALVSSWEAREPRGITFFNDKCLISACYSQKEIHFWK